MSAATAEMMIRIAADASKLRSEMEDAKKTVAFSAEGMAKAADMAKAAIVGMLGIGSIAALKNMVDGVIEGQAAMHDLSIATGVSVAALGQFRSVGAYTETSAESIAAAVLKLSKNFATADEEGKGAALALKAIGVNFDDFKKQSPDERMLTVAKALGEFRDGSDKSAAAMALFGKEGAKMLPFLADLAEEAESITAKLTDQEVASKAAASAMADAYGDNLIKIRKQSEGWKKDLAMGLLPVMYEASEAILGMGNGTGGLKEKISQLAKDGTFAEWGRNLLMIFSYLVDAVQVAWRVIETVVKGVTGWVAGLVNDFTHIGDAIAAFVKGDFSGAVKIMQDRARSTAAIVGAAGESIAETWSTSTLGAQFRGRMADMQGVQVEAKATKKELDLAATLEANKKAQEAETAAKKAAEAAQKKLAQQVEAATKAGTEYVANLADQNKRIQEEVDLGRKLTPLEEKLRDLDRDIASGKKILTAEQYAHAKAVIEDSEALVRQRDWMIESRKENEKSREELQKRIDTVRADTEKQREANEVYGKSARELAALKAARLEEMAVAAEKRAQLLDEVDWTGQLGDKQRELAQAYRDSAKEVQNGEHLRAAKESADEWKKTIDSVNSGLTDALMRAFESGKGFADAFKSTLMNAFRTMVLQPVIKAIVQPVGDALGSMLGVGGGSGGGLGALLGGGSGGGMGGLGGLGGLGGMLGSFGSGFSGGWSLAANGGFSTGFDAISGGWTSLMEGNGLGGGLGQMVGAGSQMLGTAGGYLNAFNAAKNGKWGSAAGSALGTYFGGPIGGAIGNFLGGAVDGLFGGDGKDYFGADYMRSSKATAGYRPQEREVGDRQYGWSITGARSDKVESALKGITDASIGAISSLQAAFGGTADYKLGTYFSNNGEISQGNIKLMRDGQTLTSSSSGSYGKDGDAGFKAYATDVAKTVRSAIDGIGLPSWASGMLDKLGDAPSIEELVSTVNQIASTQRALTELPKALNPLGGIFSTIATASQGARENLASLAGGVEKLMIASKQFAADYYSKDEQAGMAAKDAMDTLKGLGIDGSKLASREDFRALVESLGSKIEDKEAQKQLVGLLAMGKDFAQLADYLKESGKTLEQAANAAPQTAILQQILNPTQSTAEAVTDVADKIDTSNVKLDGVITALKEGNGSLGGLLSAAIKAISAVESAVTSGNLIAAGSSKKLEELAADAALSGAAPAYRYDMGGGR